MQFIDYLSEKNSVESDGLVEAVEDGDEELLKENHLNDSGIHM